MECNWRLQQWLISPFHTAISAQFVSHYYLAGSHCCLPDILFFFSAMNFPKGEDKEEELGGKGTLNSVSERDSNVLMFLQN